MTDKKEQKPDTKPQLTQEQIKQLMAMMQNQKPLTKWQQYSIKAINYLSAFTKFAIAKMERFINFIIKDHDIDRNDVVQTARGPILFGTYVIIIFVVIGGLWASLAPLDSAATAIGTVIPSSKKKTISHLTGGTIKEIYVQLGDQVKEGDKILELDEVRAKSEYETTLGDYRTALASEDRLVAERDNLQEIEFDEFLTNDASDPKVAKIMATQRELFFSKSEFLKKKFEALEQRHLQIQKQLEGAEARLISTRKTKDVMEERLKSMTELFNKGFVNRSQFLDAEAKTAETVSQLSATEAEVARLKQALTEDTASLMSQKNGQLADTYKELNEAQRAVNQIKERYSAVKDALDKIIVRSPVDGTIIEMYHSTIGGVIGGGHPIAEIIPTGDHLIVEARIPSREIDAVKVGLKAKIKFSAFKSRTSPVFQGTIVSLSPDTVQDSRQQQDSEGPKYVAKIEINMEEFNRISKGKLVLRPGMQAEVNIVRGTRTLIQYLLDPVTDQMFKAFKEK